MRREKDQYQPHNVIAVLVRMINVKVIQDKLKKFKKPPPLQGININDQFLSLIELTTDHKALKVISYAMEPLPQRVAAKLFRSQELLLATNKRLKLSQVKKFPM